MRGMQGSPPLILAVDQGPAVWGRLGSLDGIVGHAIKMEIPLTLAMNTLCCCWLRIAIFVDMAGV